MISRKQLEIALSSNIQSFEHPKIELEQYQTPPRVAANLLHFAQSRGDIEGKSVIDICAGTGILGLGAALLGATVTLVEIDEDIIPILENNAASLGVEVTIINSDIFSADIRNTFDTALLNPPFGIQQRKYRDMRFVLRAAELASIFYAIHDGSPTNQQQLANQYIKHGLVIKEHYLDEFPIAKSYPWHKMKYKPHSTLIIKGSRELFD